MLDRIQKHIEIIAQESSKTGKQQLVKDMCDKYKHAEKVLNYALSPFITFGLANSINEPQEHGNVPEVEDMVFFGLLEDLKTRKLSGNAAIEEVNKVFQKLSYPTAVLLYNVIQKDLRAGFSISTVNKALGYNAIYEFNTMLAHKYDPKCIKQWPVYVEPKLDGMRCIARVTSDSVQFLSRNGKPITSIPHLESELLSYFPTTQVLYIDGELTAGDNFNISISALRKADKQAQNARFHIFDVLYEADFLGLSKTVLEDRLTRIPEFSQASALKNVSASVVFHHEAVLEAYEKVFSQGGEGVIVKDPQGIYEPKRSHAWMKIKDCNDVDLKVVGYFEGQGKYEGKLGGIIVDHNGVEVRVGSGFSDSDRKMLWSGPEAMIDQTVEIVYHEVTPDGSLRHPRFVRFRDDK